MKDKELNDITRLYDRFIRQCPGTEEYTQRLAEETQIILKLRFVDYFIQICDIIAMTRDIPHMTRGSAGSSLVCYLLGITDVDPVEWGIPVARFLNPNRDDLPDGGSNHFHDVIIATRKKNPHTTIEVLTPDFLRKGEAYKKVLEANPDVFNHNIETVPSLYLKVRPGARYFGSLELLKNSKKFNKKVFTKSGLMVGFGETKDEIIQVMDDLRSAEVDFLTIGQYLQPSVKHFPLNRYYHPDEFDELGKIAKSKGFLLVTSSPLTRSSYHADDDFDKLKKNRNIIN